jgi:hypothetical protein
LASARSSRATPLGARTVRAETSAGEGREREVSERPQIVVVAVALVLSLGCISACGDARVSHRTVRPPAVSPRAAAPSSLLRGDNDEVEGHHREDDDALVRGFGHRASARSGREVAAAIGRYLAAAAAGEGVAACALMSARLLHDDALALEAEAYGPSPAAPSLIGRPCAYIARLLFGERHASLSALNASAVVTAVRVLRARTIAILASHSLPERQMPLVHERGAWRIDSLLDREIP